MKTELVDIDILISDPNNARLHGEKNLDAIRGSIKKFGVVEPLVVRKQNNVVIGGNGRLEVLKSLGIKEVPVHYVDFDDQKSKALALALNRTSELAEWDDETLGKSLQALFEDGFDIASIGFDPGEFEVSDPEKDATEDEVPEVEENIHGVKLGDIWKLGEHRLMCGDSTSKEDVERLMNGEKADMVFTDPPYGMNLDTDFSSMKSNPAWLEKTGAPKSGGKYKKVDGDDGNFDPSFLLNFFHYVKEIFLWGADYYAERISNKNEGSWIVWDKRIEESTDKIFGSSFELCWSKTRHKRDLARIRWAGIYGTEKEHDKKRVHPTQKPTALVEWFFERFKGQLVIDLFLGSGSTLIACEKTNRKCYGMEIDPHYCSVIIERFEKYSGKKAVRL